MQNGQLDRTLRNKGLRRATRKQLTYLASNSAGATVPHEMSTTVQAETGARLMLCQKKAVRTHRKSSKTECLFARRHFHPGVESSGLNNSHR